MRHRSTLRDYVRQMEEGRLTSTELADYIAKGGSYQAVKSYDSGRNFMVGAPSGAVLRYFINGPHLSSLELPADRLDSLALLLAVGADPNLSSEGEAPGGADQLSPTLFAAAGNDLDALRLLVPKGGDIERREQKYAGTYGPALALTTKTEVLDFLLASGARLDFKDDAGNNLLLLAVEQAYVSPRLERVQWLLRHGLSPKEANQDGATADDRAAALLALAQSQFADVRQQHEQRMRDAMAETWPGLELGEEELAQRRQALASTHEEQWRTVFQQHSERLARLETLVKVLREPGL